MILPGTDAFPPPPGIPRRDLGLGQPGRLALRGQVGDQAAALLGHTAQRNLAKARQQRKLLTGLTGFTGLTGLARAASCLSRAGPVGPGRRTPAVHMPKGISYLR